MSTVKKFLSLAMAATMAVSLAVPAAAAGNPSFSDVPEGRWSYSYVAKAVSEGWMEPVSKDAFGASEPADYGTFCRALEKAVLRSPDVDPGDETTLPAWYRGVSGVASTGALKGTDLEDPAKWVERVGNTVDRSTMAIVLDRLARHVGLIDPQSGRGADGGEFDEMDPVAVQAFLECGDLGILAGYPDGSLGHADPMTREQCAKVVCILADLADELSNKPAPPDEPEVPVPDPDGSKAPVASP